MNSPMRKSRTGIFVSGFVINAAFLAACGQAPAVAPVVPATAPAVAVSADTAHRGDIQQTLALSGEIRAREQISVQPKTSGRVERVLVDVGSHVKAGDIIAVLDQDNPRMQVLQARAALAQAQAHLTTLQAGPRAEDVATAHAAVAQQQTRLQSMRSGGRAEDIQIAEGSLAAAKAKLQMVLNGADEGVRQSAQSAVDSDKDALASAQAAFAALGAQNAASLQTAHSQADTFAAQIVSAQAQIDSADAALTNLTGSSAADVQAAQSAFDQASSQLQTARATLKQNYNPPQAAIAQAEAVLEGARSQRTAAQAQQTALEQKSAGACADMPGAPRNSTACNSAKAAASSAVSAAEAAVNAAQGQLDLLKRGGSPAQQAELQAAADQAQVQVKTAQARLDSLTSGGIAAVRAQAQAQKQQAQGQLVQAQENLKVAQANLSAVQSGSLDVQVKSAQAQVTSAGERLKSDQARLDIIEQGPTDEDLVQAEVAVDQAQQGILRARQPYTIYDLQQQEQALAQAEAQLEKAQNPFTEQDLGSAQAAVDQVQAKLDIAQLGLSETTVLAPVDGVISERTVAAGMLVSAQTPLVTLVPPSLEVVVNVPESQLGQLRDGQPVQLEVAAFPGESFTAEVNSISPTLDSKSRTAAVHISPRDDAQRLRAGMFAQLSIVTAQRYNALLVAKSAIDVTNGQTRVATIDSSNLVGLTAVQVGIQNDSFAEIVSGIDDGQLVATSGTSNLHDGEAVAPHMPVMALVR